MREIRSPEEFLPCLLRGLLGPERLPDIESPVDFLRAQEWTFEPVDFETFPALTLARTAVSESATHPAVYNAANEVFVQAFLEERLPYLSIVDLLAQVLGEHSGIAQPSVEDILGVEEWARNRAEHLCAY